LPDGDGHSPYLPRPPVASKVIKQRLTRQHITALLMMADGRPDAEVAAATGFTTTTITTFRRRPDVQEFLWQMGQFYLAAGEYDLKRGLKSVIESFRKVATGEARPLEGQVAAILHYLNRAGLLDKSHEGEAPSRPAVFVDARSVQVTDAELDVLRDILISSEKALPRGS